MFHLKIMIIGQCVQECSSLRQELQQLRRDNSSLDAGAHEKEKSLTQLRTRVAVLEQELLDKEQVLIVLQHTDYDKLWYIQCTAR